MEMWDQEFIDMGTEGHFSFGKDEIGSFQFGLVQGQIDYRIGKLVKPNGLNSHGKVKTKMMRL